MGNVHLIIQTNSSDSVVEVVQRLKGESESGDKKRVSGARRVFCGEIVLGWMSILPRQ
jgi:hypothetical protein